MKHAIARRRAIAQRAAKYTQRADASGAEFCTCGAIRDEHDIAPDFTQPCERTGCLNFTEEEDPGHTPPDLSAPGACSPELWRDYIHQKGLE
jgi:hypothetical protein